MAQGTVRWFNTNKGYGVIEADRRSGSSEEDVYVYMPAVVMAGMKTLLEGQRISFEVVPDERRNALAAANLKLQTQMA